MWEHERFETKQSLGHREIEYVGKAWVERGGDTPLLFFFADLWKQNRREVFISGAVRRKQISQGACLMLRRRREEREYKNDRSTFLQSNGWPTVSNFSEW